MTREELQGRIIEAKAQNSVPSILEKYGVTIRRNKCACPFHKYGQEKHYSMQVNKDYAYCHTCNESADIIKLVMHFENCSFVEAVGILLGDNNMNPYQRMKQMGKGFKRKRETYQKQSRKDFSNNLKTLIEQNLTRLRSEIDKLEPFSSSRSNALSKIQYLENCYQDLFCNNAKYDNKELREIIEACSNQPNTNTKLLINYLQQEEQKNVS